MAVTKRATNKLIERVLAKRLPHIAQRIQELAEGEGLALNVAPDIRTSSLVMSGQGLLKQQFGDRGTAPTLPITRLIHAAASKRRRT